MRESPMGIPRTAGPTEIISSHFIDCHRVDKTFHLKHVGHCPEAEYVHSFLRQSPRPPSRPRHHLGCDAAWCRLPSSSVPAFGFTPCHRSIFVPPVSFTFLTSCLQFFVAMPFTHHLRISRYVFVHRAHLFKGELRSEFASL